MKDSSAIHEAIPMTVRHAAQVAALHAEGIPTGFLSSLGPRFLRTLYEQIAVGPTGFGFVVCDASGVLGFAANTMRVGALYREVLFCRPVEVLSALVPRMCCPPVFRKILETALYPAQVEKTDLPAEELLSIVVSPRGRGRGVGRALVEATAAEFARRGARRFRVVVGGELAANLFYQRLGFQLAASHEMHGAKANIYVHDA